MWFQILIGILVFWVIVQAFSMWFMTTDAYNGWLSKVINRSIDTAIEKNEKWETEVKPLEEMKIKSFKEMWKEEFEKHEDGDSN